MKKLVIAEEGELIEISEKDVRKLFKKAMTIEPSSNWGEAVWLVDIGMDPDEKGIVDQDPDADFPGAMVTHKDNLGKDNIDLTNDAYMGTDFKLTQKGKRYTKGDLVIQEGWFNVTV